MNTESESFEPEPASDLAAYVVMAIAAIIIVSFFFLFVSRIRSDSRRSISIEKLKSIGFATLSFEETYEHMPSADVSHRAFGASKGWEIKIRPFMDTFCIGWDNLETSEWDAPECKERSSYLMPEYMSPHLSEEYNYDENGYGLCHYSATLEVIPFGEPKLLEDLDGNKKMYGEIAAGYQPWAKPGNSRTIGNGIWFDEKSFGNPEYNGCCFAFVDGSVRYEVLDRDRRK